MKKRYIRRVRLELDIPYKKKKEIIRDLEEIFASAAEHGESEQEVIDRLGPAEEFAAEMKAQTVEDKPEKLGVFAYILAIFSILLMGTVLAVKLFVKSTRNYIGYADSMTGIQIIGGSSLDLIDIVLAVMLLLCVIALARVIYIMAVRLRK